MPLFDEPLVTLAASLFVGFCAGEKRVPPSSSSYRISGYKSKQPGHANDDHLKALTFVSCSQIERQKVL
jgi:hypothetical protein